MGLDYPMIRLFVRGEGEPGNEANVSIEATFKTECCAICTKSHSVCVVRGELTARGQCYRITQCLFLS